MRLLVLTLSIAFAVYGLLPYHKVGDVKTTKPNELIIDQQECGCPCPDAGIIKGQLQIPQDIASKYTTLNTSQINLNIKDFNEPYNYELGHARLFIKGKVVGADTILCDPTNCEVAARFQVDSWSLVDTVARVWTFPSWVALLFVINLLIIMPTLTIIEIAKLVRKRNLKQGSSLR